MSTVLHVDTGATARRRAALQAYFAENVLDGNRFVCAHEQACRSAAARAGGRFWAGQLSYLGSHYDLIDDGVPLRVLIVPMDVGRGPSGVAMELRAEQIRQRIPQTFRQRNPHMRGVTLALRLAFGNSLDEDPAGEFIVTNTGAVHVLDAYAMANLLLCSAVAGRTGTQSLGTKLPVMKNNCRPHLHATIRLLEPTLVLSQGSAVHPEIAKGVAIERSLSNEVFAVRLDGRPFAWAALHHPAFHWDWLSRPYLKNTVADAMHRGRELALELAIAAG